MRLPFVLRRDLDRVEQERAAWQDRAEMQLAITTMLSSRLTALEEQVYKLPKKKRRRLLAPLVATVYVFVIGVVVGGAAIPHINDRPTLTDDTTFTATVKKPETVKMSPLTFSWPPTPKASSYRLGFYSGSAEVLVTQSRRPRKTVTLSPGEYRWVVWPIVQGVQTKATISSVLLVP